MAPLSSPACPFHCISERPQVDTSNGGNADIDSNWDEAIDSFDGMGLPEELLRGIYSYGFEQPSAIHQRAIKPVAMGHGDLSGQER